MFGDMAAAQSRPQPTGKAKVYIWDFRGKDVAWGHASMELDDGTYISFWPGSERDKIIGSIYSAEEIPNQTHADVIMLEGQAPDHMIQINNIDTAAVKTWWGSWQADNQWSTLTTNCSDTVYQALRAGGKPYRFEFIWTPNAVKEYANDVKN
jgi:hypothetical protein